MKRQAGFTLVELIIVIVILGILAAYAVPKFMSIDKEARAAVVKGLGGSVRTASDMVHALAIAQGKATLDGTAVGDEVSIGGGAVKIAYGYAQATTDGIVAALNDLSSDFNVSTAAGIVTFAHKNARTAASCQVTYTYAGTAGTVPVINPSTTDCS